MKLFNVRPNAFHLNYADFATLAASRIAREVGAKIVFIVTPDPHRRLSSSMNAHIDPSIERASKELTKVFISDWLIQFSNGLIGIGGQHRLVKAWVNSKLSSIFDLILIGGDLESPSDEEQEVLNDIHSALLNRSDFKGAFCHLPALENKTVRCLQNALACTHAPGSVSIYVAPSLKEEFGLAILEAMSAGFLAVTPEVGGVSTYIKNEMNGFLIDTATSETIQKGLEHILLEGNYESEDLRKIAGRGMKTVLNEYNLKRIARRYAQYYTELFESAQ